MTRRIQRAPNCAESVRVRTLEDALGCIVHIRDRLNVANLRMTQQARTSEDAANIREIRAALALIQELHDNVLQSHPNRRQHD
jgi:hypothetical protein